jgi:hypothetical protein
MENSGLNIYWYFHKSKKKQSYPRNGPWRPLGLWDVETISHFLNILLTDGVDVSHTLRPLFTPQKDFLFEAESTQRP